MNKEKRIENYFDRVKKNPPLMDIERVHQIITETEVKAKAKKGHRNILKFIVMSTLFAIILSAFLFWPNAQEEIPNPRDQISKDSAQIISIDANQGINAEEETNIPIPDNEIKKVEEVVTISENKAEEKSSPSIEKNMDNSLILFSADTKINGSKYILKLSDEELTQIGFYFSDTSITYNNRIGIDYIFYQQKYKMGISQFIKPDGTLSDTLAPQETTTTELSSVTRLFESKFTVNNFFPVYQTNDRFQVMKKMPIVRNEDFKLVNDTLLPIYIAQKKILYNETDIILWFKITDELVRILSPKYSNCIEDLIEIKELKKNNRNIDVIQYPYKTKPILKNTIVTEVITSEFKLSTLSKNNRFTKQILDSTSFIILSESQLKDLGFRFFDDLIELRFKLDQREMGTYWGEKGMGIHLNIDKDNDEYLSNHSVKNIIPMFVTNEVGNGNIKLNMSLDYLKKIYLGDLNENTITLLPVKIKKNIYNGNYPKENLIYWFLPTKEFFNSIPQKISEELLNEYNYINTPNKSDIEKPECKYFDECKNTLKVTNFKVFPNPANSQATVSFNLSEPINGKISLVDLSGRERQILQPQTQFGKGDHRFDLDVSQVPEGIYLITLYSDMGIQTKRFILSH